MTMTQTDATGDRRQQMLNRRRAILLPPSTLRVIEPDLRVTSRSLPTVAASSRARDIRPERQQIAEAFRKLRKLGYSARMGVDDFRGNPDRDVWFTASDSRHDFDELGYLRHTLYLNWSGDAIEIVAVLLAEGLEAAVPTRPSSAIQVRSSGRGYSRGYSRRGRRW